VIARTLELALLPLSLFLELSLASAALRLARRPRAARAVAGAAFALLVAASSPLVVRLFVGRMERAFPAIPAGDSPRADAILVLGGAVAGRVPPRTDIELADASDRLLHAARLFRAGRAPIVVVSGGRLPSSASSVPEAAEMSELLQEWGVPAEAIVREERSTTTRENAVESARVLRARGVGSVLLVTSARHMKRALAAFRAVGLDATPSATDFTVVDKAWTPGDLVPDADALRATTELVHEALGLLYYRARGWAA